MLVSYSIVSHGQGHLIKNLLGDFRNHVGPEFEIILTLNIPEDESFFADFQDLPLKIIRNSVTKGFGANHNFAFSESKGKFFVVVNPDIRLADFNISHCLNVLSINDVGACAPVVLSSRGAVQDSVRFYPTFRRLIKRLIFNRREADYNWGNEPIQVDWAAGMFVIFRHQAFQQVKGFNETYFMYMEDADICRRLKKHRWKTLLQPSTYVIHDAQRASMRNMKHLKWHLTSLLKFMILT